MATGPKACGEQYPANIYHRCTKQIGHTGRHYDNLHGTAWDNALDMAAHMQPQSTPLICGNQAPDIHIGESGYRSCKLPPIHGGFVHIAGSPPDATGWNSAKSWHGAICADSNSGAGEHDGPHYCYSAPGHSGKHSCYCCPVTWGSVPDVSKKRFKGTKTQQDSTTTLPSDTAAQHQRIIEDTLRQHTRDGSHAWQAGRILCKCGLLVADYDELIDHMAYWVNDALLKRDTNAP